MKIAERILWAGIGLYVLIGLIVVGAESGSKWTLDTSLTVIVIAIAFATYLIVKRQRELQEYEITLVAQQGEILQRQDRLLHQRARLIVWATVTQGSPIWTTSTTVNDVINIEFTVLNVGSRSARAATLELLTPSQYQMDTRYAQEAWYATPDETGLVRWRRELLDRYFFVDIPIKLASRIAFSYGRDQFKSPLSEIRWRIAFEDGVEPGRGEWEPLTTQEAIADKFRPLLERAGPLPAP